MANFKQLFTKYMDKKDIKYTEVAEHVVRVGYSGENSQSIGVFVFFDKEGGDAIQLVCRDLPNFKENMAAGLVACNSMNAKYRWVKFYLDDDGDMCCSIDAYIEPDTCGEECMKLVARVVSIVDESYPVFMKARWGNN